MPGLLPPSPPRRAAALFPRHAVSTSRERNYLNFGRRQANPRPRRIQQRVPPPLLSTCVVAAVTVAPRSGAIPRHDVSTSRKWDLRLSRRQANAAHDFSSSETCSPQPPPQIQDSRFRLPPSDMARPFTDQNLSAARPSSSPPSPASKIRHFERRFQRFFFPLRGPRLVINANIPFGKFEISRSRKQGF
ncbi:hypothetical protein R3P38DRAFT_3176665 [Favolaschia claudopus]|uniref:Uncharacterized protein n=1 Tax=Favolaschia claudopus TaxID=2862362 RepID=A0AAW0D031_9AGAR